jgi:hypothetical protein
MPVLLLFSKSGASCEQPRWPARVWCPLENTVATLLARVITCDETVAPGHAWQRQQHGAMSAQRQRATNVRHELIAAAVPGPRGRGRQPRRAVAGGPWPRAARSRAALVGDTTATRAPGRGPLGWRAAARWEDPSCVADNLQLEDRAIAQSTRPLSSRLTESHACTRQHGRHACQTTAPLFIHGDRKHCGASKRDAMWHVHSCDWPEGRQTRSGHLDCSQRLRYTRRRRPARSPSHIAHSHPPTAQWKLHPPPHGPKKQFIT